MLGEEIGQGGEGIVFAVDGQPSLVAKVYHHLPLPSDDVAKLDAFVSCRLPELDKVSAWPQAIVYDSAREAPCGILLPKVEASRHLHELYGTYNRRRYFPEVKWHHLLLAARNVAAAFHALHAAGVIVGDVNQGNLMVDHQMCVRFIDCDSFQISRNGKVFPCPVGTPHFTPPELQSKKLRDVLRTPNHDRFGMAILIFHLLFVGRHPFAGRFRGAHELSIERAIAERRFAFSRHKRETLVDPPPASLLLDDLPDSVGQLFEQAFRATDDQAERPNALQWVQCLEALIQERKYCSLDASHVFFSRLVECPWCRVEDEGGPAFFLSGDAAIDNAKDRLAALDAKIRGMKIKTFPEISPQRFAVPHAPRPERPATKPRMSLCDAAAILLVASVIPSLAGAASGISLVAGSACAVLAGGILLFGKEARRRRGQSRELALQLARIQDKLRLWSRAIIARHSRRKLKYDNARDEVRVECDHFLAEGDRVHDVLVLQRGTQKERFLAKHLIQDNVRRIPGLNFSMVSMLESFGVESALDVDKLKLTGIPVLGPSLNMELLTWREQLEVQFRYKPDHGITFDELRVSKEDAVARFKVAQARRVLMAAKQVDTLAIGARYELDGELKKYDAFAAQGDSVVQQLRDLQNNRRRLEWWVNRSWTTILGLTLGAPLVGALAYWLIHGVR